MAKLRSPLQQWKKRKRDHIRLSLDPSLQWENPVWDEWVLKPWAIPNLRWPDDIGTHRQLFGQRVHALFVSGMTLGTRESTQILNALAYGCQQKGWILGLGSQKYLLGLEPHEPEFKAFIDWRHRWSQVPLLGNLGLTDLIQSGPQRVLKLIQMTQPLVFMIHVNALQEAIQPEGQPWFENSWRVIEKLVKQSPVPIGVKEVGCGITGALARRLFELGVQVVDVAGAGGLHWGRLEGQRALQKGERWRYELSQTFRNWGWPTPWALKEIQADVPPSQEVWASGGIRTGLDAAKAMALGAKAVGFASAIIPYALKGPQAVLKFMEQKERELSLACFLAGAPDPWHWPPDAITFQGPNLLSQNPNH